MFNTTEQMFSEARALTCAPSEWRKTAKRALAMRTPEAMKFVSKGLRRDELRNRLFSARLLKQHARQFVIEDIRHGLSDQDRHVRMCAATALGVLKDEPSISSLVSALQDSNKNVQHNAALALGRLGGNEATSALEAILDSERLSARIGAIEGLASIDEPHSVGLLEATAKRDQSGLVRFAATDLLSSMKDEEAVGALKRLLASQERAVRIATLKVLASNPRVEFLHDLEAARSRPNLEKGEQAKILIALWQLSRVAPELELAVPIPARLKIANGLKRRVINRVLSLFNWD